MFIAPLVRAILSSQKTQTRRVIRPRPACVKNGNRFTLSGLPPTPIKCPVGKPSDRIHGRETFGYCSDVYTPDICFRVSQLDAPIQGCWHPAIHMRKADARIWLEITDLRVDRLQSISEEDAKAEGTWPDKSIVSDTADYFKCSPYTVHPSLAFRALWESTGGDWGANPWVWMTDFKRIEKPR